MDILSDNLRIIRLRLFLLKNWRSQSCLARVKYGQREKFDGLKSKFSNLYRQLSKGEDKVLATGPWEESNDKLEQLFLPYPPFYFLRDSTIMKVMFVTAGGHVLKEELSFIEGEYSIEKLRDVLLEDYIGGPLLLIPKYLTSHNSIHQFYHLARFLKKTGCDLLEVHSVVDWGGGYGAMAKILRRFKTRPFTYTIIDTPLFCCIQWLYLSVVFGEEEVNLLQDSSSKIKSNKINILPVTFLKKKRIKADMFISTWGLSECPKELQDFVIKNNFFSAKHLILGYQKSNQGFPVAERVGEYAAKKGATREEIKFLPGNYYAFL